MQHCWFLILHQFNLQTKTTKVVKISRTKSTRDINFASYLLDAKLALPNSDMGQATVDFHPYSK